MILKSKEQAQGFAADLIDVVKRAHKLNDKYENVAPCYGTLDQHIQIHKNIELLAELLCCTLKEVNFNEKYSKLYFYYAGYEFFQLRSKQ